jgi:predicted GTPase
MSTLTNDNLHVLKKFITDSFFQKESLMKDILFEETEGFSKLNSKAERTINIMLLGEPRVGKSTFFGQFFDNDRTDGNYLVTVGI